MRWKGILRSVGLTLAVSVGSVTAQSSGQPPSTPYLGNVPGPYGVVPPAAVLPNGTTLGGSAPMLSGLPANSLVVGPTTMEPPLPGMPLGPAPVSGYSSPVPVSSYGGPAPEGRIHARALVTPNMFGDLSTGGNRLFTLSTVQNTRLGGTFFSTLTGLPANFNINTIGGTTTFSVPAGVPVSSFGQPITSPFIASGGLTPTSQGLVYPLLPNAQDQAATLAFAQTTLGPGGTLTYVSSPEFSRAAPVSATQANISTFYDYAQLVNRAATTIPSPSSGVIGRTKVSTDNNPLPRDRVILDYNFFNGIQLGPNTSTLHRFSPGVELTFFDQLASVEVRVPFGVAFNNNIFADGPTSEAANLGNLHVTFKLLLLSYEWFHLAGGLGMGAPTGADIALRLENGTELMKITNEALILTPYIAALITPNDKWFAQLWYACDFDPMGNSVDVNFDGTRLRSVGRIYDAPLSQVDGQIGCWLYRNDTEYAFCRGLAGFVEAHYNTTFGSGTARIGPNYSLARTGDVEELNVTLGMSAWFGTNVLLSAGCGIPVLGGDNSQSFDFTVGVRGSIFFGPTARNRAISVNESQF